MGCWSTRPFYTPDKAVFGEKAACEPGGKTEVGGGMSYGGGRSGFPVRFWAFTIVLMGQPTPHSPVLLLLAAFSRHEDALDWARERAVEAWGPVVLESPRFEFAETHYYDATMGAGLKKVFFAFRQPFEADRLIDVKLQTNAWEEEYAGLVRQTAGETPAPQSGTPAPQEPRPLNLDPGYLTLGKLVLASTKDFAHRIYLGRGIYAEVTLQYKHKRWQHHEYTFPDYRRADYQAFFTECRDVLRRMRDEGWSG
ncbi:MAG: DUF4416 family protein [Planctomycetaceae bacterium]|nr:DUF4416 family protein [Planctomycetaceae bacterium]